ncbi:MAG TPA: IS66 family insertion sequence element accessory protein TnpB [Gammaproteobacteria bacterium]|jgi:transposase|nr:IS66 family insertion sequence element accessory protein TnpB [Gammaproteobacteria bacterium]|tara:strand:- start:1947 stop:2345 length:399 start_codon:yes stop_codon:yes gene_type:complete
MHGLLPSVTAAQTRIYLYAQDVDMRRSFDGLMAIVQTAFDKDIRQGDCYLFINKRRDRLKILWWDGDGLAIFMKRLEQGTFQRPVVEADNPYVQMDRTELGLLLSGIDLTSVKRRKRYRTRALPSSPLTEDK